MSSNIYNYFDIKLKELITKINNHKNTVFCLTLCSFGVNFFSLNLCHNYSSYVYKINKLDLFYHKIDF